METAERGSQQPKFFEGAVTDERDYRNVDERKGAAN